jgi:hypothetical protein
MEIIATDEPAPRAPKMNGNEKRFDHNLMTTLRRLFGGLLWEEKWIKLITISVILQQTLHYLSQKENFKKKL